MEGLQQPSIEIEAPIEQLGGKTAESRAERGQHLYLGLGRRRCEVGSPDGFEHLRARLFQLQQ
ncbi:hypothetical protein ACIA5D_26170 [Actinoplanes sp. NPDC051513]|uniref:hypothetical protein n=1 Tax=Actinoplanes sp. NPDC051513 TaxID=3363908 RepID=UPI0037A5B061